MNRLKQKGDNFMRSYRLYENLDPEANISGEDFDLVSQVNESVMLSRIFQMVKEDVIKKGAGSCQNITFIDELGRDLCVKNYYDLVIIMKNLLSNAVQSGASKIEVVTKVEQEELKIVVSDDGQGICAEHKPYLFTPHFSTKEMKINHVSGLGLYNVRKAVINSKGKFGIESTPGFGTICTVCFPLDEILAEKGQ